MDNGGLDFFPLIGKADRKVSSVYGGYDRHLIPSDQLDLLEDSAGTIRFLARIDGPSLISRNLPLRR